MKRMWLFAITIGLLGGYGVAADELGDNCGCGLGSVLFQGKESLVAEIFAVTTNQVTGTQTFGISSGTSGCDQPIMFVANPRLNRFVAYNLDNLARDIAAGGGEFVDALAALMHVPAAKSSAFRVGLQRNYARIFPSVDVDHEEALRHILGVYNTI